MKDNKLIDKTFIEVKNILRRVHFWLKQDPTSKEICEIFLIVLLGLISVELLLLFCKPLYDYISSVLNIEDKIIIVICGFIWTALGCIFLIIIKIFEIITEQKVKFPLRYKVLLALLAIPFILFVHKLLIVPFSKNYERKM